jgi:hypothetical protein
MNPSASSVSITEALLSFIFILLVAIAALSYLVPPAVVPESAPATDFSAERAIEHLKVIAREPHPAGSIAKQDLPWLGIIFAKPIPNNYERREKS